MKTSGINTVISLALFTFFTLFFYSCSDKCKKVLCANEGICIDGVCGCQPGFEGDDCSTKTQTKFLGTYNVADNCSVTGNALYTVNILADDSNHSQVYISNFNNDFAGNVRATIGLSTIEIPPQYPDSDGRSVSGNGILSGSSTIIWNYTISNPGNSTNSCNNSVWVK
jgi:hypothetical protein